MTATRFDLRWLALAGCGLLAVLLRLPFLGTGIGPDEGGYAYVASRWAHGVQLYSQIWIDRPQGLMLAYRALLQIADRPWAIRLGAVLFGAAITLLLGAIGWLLRGSATGIATAGIYAIVGVAPHVEGFTFNGELAAALPATGAVAAVLAWKRSQRSLWLLIAGFSGSTAALMKQSGFDGLVVAVVVVLAFGAPRSRLRFLGTLLAAAAVPLAASALHGAAVGWHAYWSDVVGYKLGAASGAGANFTQRLAHLSSTIPRAWSDLWAVALVAAVGLGIALVRRAPSFWIPAVWLAAALCGFNVATSYWSHYYVQLIAPLALLAAVTATGMPRRALAALTALSCTLPVLVLLARVSAMPEAQRERAIPYYASSETDVRVADAVRADTGPATPIYVLASRADLYFLSDRRADYEYLWGHPLQEIRGALGRLRALLASVRRPRWIFVYQPADKVDPSGALDRVLDRWYRFEGRVPRTSVGILRALS